MSQYCEVCGNEIPEDRLECVPDTVLCIEHAQAMQKYGGEFTLTGVCGNIGKAGSLKKNYGDVDVTRKRNYDGLRKLKEDLGQ